MEKITLDSLTKQFIETAITYVGNYDFVRIIAEDIAGNCFCALTESGNDENSISDWFEYLQKHGCLSGATQMFIDDIDCKRFYSEHNFDLDEWIYSLDFEERPSLEEPRFSSMCWFTYEYIAEIIYDNSYLGYAVEEDNSHIETKYFVANYDFSNEHSMIHSGFYNKEMAESCTELKNCAITNNYYRVISCQQNHYRLTKMSLSNAEETPIFEELGEFECIEDSCIKLRQEINNAKYNTKSRTYIDCNEKNIESCCCEDNNGNKIIYLIVGDYRNIM